MRYGWLLSLDCDIIIKMTTANIDNIDNFVKIIESLIKGKKNKKRFLDLN